MTRSSALRQRPRLRARAEHHPIPSQRLAFIAAALSRSSRHVASRCTTPNPICSPPKPIPSQTLPHAGGVASAATPSDHERHAEQSHGRDAEDAAGQHAGAVEQEPRRRASTPSRRASTTPQVSAAPGDERRGQAHREAASDGAGQRRAEAGGLAQHGGDADAQGDGRRQKPDDEPSFGGALVGRDERRRPGRRRPCRRRPGRARP